MARTVGAKNKLSGLAKENIAAVFTRLGGTAAMAKWAKDNQGEFYRIYSRLLPHEVSTPEGESINVIHRIERVIIGRTQD